MAKGKNKKQTNSSTNQTANPLTKDTGIRKTINKFILLLALISLAAYANTANHGYAYDDFSVIKENTIVTKGMSAIPEIFSTPYRWGFFRTSNDMYRPLSLVMFAAEYQFFDGEPGISHLFNILIYACCVISLFLFLNALFDNKRLTTAFIACLLFALHPVHTEVVANIKSRDELLCFLFAMLSLNTFIKYAASGNIKQLLIAGIFFFLSLLSKETSISLIAIVPVIFLLYKNDNRQRSLLIISATVLVAVIFLGIRYYILSTHNANHVTDVLFIDNFLTGAPSLLSRMATAILILGKYLLLLLVPYPLISDYSYNSIPFVSIDNVWVVLSLLVHISLFGYATFRIVWFRRDALALGIVFYMLAIALFSNLVFLTGTAMAERFLFFPTAGFCWSVTVLFDRWVKEIPPRDIFSNKMVKTIIFPVAIFLFILTVNRNSSWKDNLTLFKADIEKAPQNARLNYYLGNEIFKHVYAGNPLSGTPLQNINSAKRYLANAITIYPEYTDAYKAMGKGYYMAGVYDSAEYYYKKTLEIKPDDIEAWSDLDVVYFKTNRFNLSIEACKKILSIDTTMTHKYKNIGTCFMQVAQYDSAIFYFKKGMKHTSDPASFYRDIAVAFRLSGNEDSAKKYEYLR